MKRILALVLAVAMLCGAVGVLSSCGNQPEEHQHSYQWKSNTEKHWKECSCGDKIEEGDHTYVDGVCSVCGAANESHVHDYVTWGKNATQHWKVCACGEKSEAVAHNFVDGVCECGAVNKYVDDGKTYTYRMAPSDLPTSWNIHTYQSNSSTYVLDYSSDALYTFDYNDNFDGFVIRPAMAAEMPVDVSADYVGRFGITEGETGKAYKITLKDNLKFDNGEALNAHSFVESLKLLLDPVAANYRADNVYQSGNLKIYNAEAYFKQGKYGLSEFVSAKFGADEYVDPADFVAGTNGVLQYNGSDIVLDITSGGNWGEPLSLYAQYGYITANKAAYDRLAAAADKNGWVKLTASLLKDLQDCIAELHGCANVEEYAAQADVGAYAYQEFEEMAFFGKTWAALNFEDVGFFAPSDNELVVVLKNAMENNFYLKYELCTNFFLVYAPLYKQCISMDGGVYNNDYGTSVDKYVGFGPYKLTQYVADAAMVLERNLNWLGYAEGEYIDGSYMTDKVSYTVCKDEATRLMMFLKGEIDSYGLQADDMKDYQSSKYTYYTDSESTWYLAMNPDYDTLKKLQGDATPVTTGNTVNKTVISITEFRQALSYSLNRAEFTLALSPTSGIAKALLSAAIVYDPEVGYTYRSTNEAKDAILKFWGLYDKVEEITGNPDAEYETRDEAIDSITGYDLAGAKSLFTEAYNKAVAAGEIPADSNAWEVQIVIGKPSEANFYTKGYEFLKACWTEAVKDTPFEGHVEFILSQTLGSTSFGTYLRQGNVDLLFGVGFSGSRFDPYMMMDCFTGNLQYDPFTDKSKITCDVDLDLGDGVKTYRASLYDWVSVCLQGDEITAFVVGENGEVTKESKTFSAGVSADSAIRLQILATTETAVLELCNVFPLMTDASAQLRCQRVNYKTEEYVSGMGFGGIAYYTYSMDDAEFAAFVKTQPDGQLNYK